MQLKCDFFFSIIVSIFISGLFKYYIITLGEGGTMYLPLTEMLTLSLTSSLTLSTICFWSASDFSVPNGGLCDRDM